MCGIAGILNTDRAPVRRETIEGMTQAIAHRGPDGYGFEIHGSAAIGHRRLAIIDLEGGRQPLSNEDGQIWITFNGEIYNFVELRRELMTKGHVFRTNSDTEVIVHAYETWGDDCVRRFRGMFAFGIMDLRRRRLFLARDHLGIKPLYYLHSPNHFSFASELQALRKIPGQPFTLDLRAIDQYLWLQYIPAPRTCFKEVCKLPPAHRMSITFDGVFSEPEEYWRLEFNPDHRRSEADWAKAAEEILFESVRTHLVSDVPFGAFLSGGIDSSLIVANMARIMSQPVRTFSIGFEEESHSELPYAKQVSKRWGTEHHVEIVKPDALAILPSLVKHYGEPFGDSSAIPTYYVSQMARRFVPMVLSGDGGDELFAGYDSYRNWMRFLTRKGWKRWLTPLAHAVSPANFPQRRATLENWLGFISYTGALQRRSLWRGEYSSSSGLPLKVFEREFERTRGYSFCHIAQYMDIKTYLPFDILTKVDIASMMHGLEVRTPLVDVRVAEFAATIPDNFNMRQGDRDLWSGKRLLKQLMRQYYPNELIDRPKQGFSIPMQKWFSPKGAKRPELQERILGRHSRLHSFFDQTALCSLLESGTTGPVWLFLYLEEWLRQNQTGVSW